MIKYFIWYLFNEVESFDPISKKEHYWSYTHRGFSRITVEYPGKCHLQFPAALGGKDDGEILYFIGSFSNCKIIAFGDIAEFEPFIDISPVFFKKMIGRL